MAVKLVTFFAILFAALTFVGPAAHLFSLSNKIGMNQSDYYVAQAVYRRWDLLGWSYLGSLAFTLALAIMLRGGGAAFWLASAGFALTALSLVIFFIWVMPGNSATQNWTVAPENWRTLRTNWEYGHAGSAVATFLALCAVAAASALGRP
ncbi:MAG TPA: hypothetical protein VEA80_01830 [Vitreimonas sp.]|uniref:hypothetical protein n=1 Tax=Vitreimonas sp. TaxID=3069702 RepID=UPI002D51BFA3|nr:hypothetical protein [Vitreimonas sp.]HYD86190.1 hypothetical protein [Vitreimonas sp.]